MSVSPSGHCFGVCRLCRPRLSGPAESSYNVEPPRSPQFNSVRDNAHSRSRRYKRTLAAPHPLDSPSGWTSSDR